MLILSKNIKLDDKAIQAADLTNRFDPDDLKKIGTYVVEGYQRDRKSRYKWERRTQAAMDLAMQVQKAKSFPWPGCSNVAFPLITIAALAFHSRAYPALIVGTDVAKCRIIGDDPAGSKTGRATRISLHMSYQCLEEQEEWEAQKDSLLINLPIVGTTFTKSYYDGDKGRKVDETVLAQDLVVDYWTKSLDSCPRKTHVIPFFRNQIHSNVKRKIFADISEEAWYKAPAAPKVQDDAARTRRDNRLGITPPETDETTPFRCLEQHVDLDLDGDGYAEPYIITVEETSQCVLRIVTGFDRPEDIERNGDGEIIQIRRMEYFTRYEFIPSPDGGIYGVGFGVLLGPLNESVNSLINQLIDAGTMSISAGGFLGRGAKMRGGQYSFAPFEWKRVDSTGDDLRKSLVQLEVRDPSNVLFNLLSLLINYVERISGTTDPMVGENVGQNTTAETMRTMVQEGQRIYTAVFKRCWRAMKQEFRKDFILNGLFMPLRKSFGQGQYVLREDYLGNPDEVRPAADPNVTSEQAQMAQAQALNQLAGTTPGFDRDEVTRRVLKSMKIDSIDQVFPGSKKVGAPEDVRVTIAKMKLQGQQAELQAEQQRFMLQLQEEYRVNSAEMAKIAAEIQNMQATTEGDKADRHVAMMQSVMKLMGERNSEILGRLDVMKKQLEVKRAQIDVNDRNAERLAGAPGNGGSSSRAQATQAEAA